MSVYPETKSKIIKATIELISEESLSRVSFDRLVKLTGISKGGILYHFPSKNALLAAVVENIEQVFIENYKTVLGSQSPHPGRALLAYLRSAIEGRLGRQQYAALVAITTEQPALLHEQKSMYQILRHDMQKDGGDFIRQWMLVAAFDGLWIDYNTHLYGLSEAEHTAFGQAMINEAHQIIDQGKK